MLGLLTAVFARPAAALPQPRHFTNPGASRYRWKRGAIRHYFCDQVTVRGALIRRSIAPSRGWYTAAEVAYARGANEVGASP